MYGQAPTHVGHFDINLSEVMYYLYLPVKMSYAKFDVRLPANVECCRDMIGHAIANANRVYQYIYLSARKGWATPDNPLNRPGWHCDGFGTDDLNFVWWRGPGTRFAEQEFVDISDDHLESLKQFEAQVKPECIQYYLSGGLYKITPHVVHATPLIDSPGCMRQYIKISLSDHQYNLENNSHNYLFNYDWPIYPREIIRNDPHKAQQDFVGTSLA